MKTIGLITTFEKITRTHVKLFFEDKQDNLMFVVDEGQAGKAIGKAGANVKRLSMLMKKRVKIMEHNNDVKEFIKNYLYPIKPDSIEVVEKVITIHAKERQTRAMMIGRNREKLQELNELLGKFFEGCEASVDE